MSTLICSFDSLHDNRVLRCCADFEAHTLHMDTQTEAGEKVSVRFTGLLAHWFENVVQDNILFGMDEITVDGFFEQYKDLSLIHISLFLFIGILVFCLPMPDNMIRKDTKNAARRK